MTGQNEVRWSKDNKRVEYRLDLSARVTPPPPPPPKRSSIKGLNLPTFIYRHVICHAPVFPPSLSPRLNTPLFCTSSTCYFHSSLPAKRQTPAAIRGRHPYTEPFTQTNTLEYIHAMLSSIKHNRHSGQALPRFAVWWEVREILIFNV